MVSSKNKSASGRKAGVRLQKRGKSCNRVDIHAFDIHVIWEERISGMMRDLFLRGRVILGNFLPEWQP
jgi:hypothetical protein